MRLIHRLSDLLRETPGAVLDDYFELEARAYTYVVTFDTAVRVKHVVEQTPQPEWIEFTDLFGAQHAVRAQDVFRISESTSRTRAAVQSFVRARRAEEVTGETSVARRE